MRFACASVILFAAIGIVGSAEPGIPTQLTFHAASDAGPVYSPDGTEIAFISKRSGNRGEVWKMNADGTNKTRLTSFGFESTLSWSPDGSKIAFANYGGARWDVWVMNADGSNKQRLTTSPLDDWWPAWSPDGSKIAYLNGPSDYLDLWIMDADGGNKQRLTYEPESLRSPTWSPDGTRIAFANPFNTAFGTSDVYVVDADGSNLVPLTTHPGNDGYTMWSHVNDRIVFTSDRTGNPEIWTMKSDGTDLQQISFHPATDSGSDYSPDGSRIAFSSTRTGEYDIFVVELVTNVALDVKPGSCPNPLALRKKDDLPAAVLGSDDLDVHTIDPTSILLNGIPAIRWAYEDVATPFEPVIGKDDCFDDCWRERKDGVLDLTLKFDAQEVISSLGDVDPGECRVLQITGSSYGGGDFQGEDVVIIREK